MHAPFSTPSSSGWVYLQTSSMAITPLQGKERITVKRGLSTFQKRPGFGVIILSPAAVGFGVNIEAANHVIHFTRAWNPAREDQATDRAYRIGQNKDVFVYYPVVVAEDFVTFDESWTGYSRSSEGSRKTC
jgi:hypothetical protein